MTFKLSPKTSILSVGTEVVSGQIINTNSSWISKKCEQFNLNVMLHLSVPDDKEALLKAFQICSQQSDHIFITGGLGPTSDDFTRTVAAEFFQKKLVFDEASYIKIKKRCETFGIELMENQKQQCYFPKGATLIENLAGTANAFFIIVNNKNYFFLPGPPLEIESVFFHSLDTIVKKIALENQLENKKELSLVQTLGQAESIIATRSEEFWKKENVELGYRVHFPYVEIKIWTLLKNKKDYEKKLADFEKTLSPYFISHGPFEAYDFLLSELKKYAPLALSDQSVNGVFSEKFIKIISQKNYKLNDFFSSLHFEINPPEGKMNKIQFQTLKEPYFFKFELENENFIYPIKNTAPQKNERAFIREQSIWVEHAFLKLLYWLQNKLPDKSVRSLFNPNS